TNCIQMLGGQNGEEEKKEQELVLNYASGSALTALLIQVLKAPGVSIFGEMLELGNVQELQELLLLICRC
uniref:Uncharacterized protein n=1 Tax=Oryctolagus cuniculus TaxID=9986 RepID=A0A5F9CT39_RABIT